MTLKRAFIPGLALIAGAVVLCAVVLYVILARTVHAPPAALARFSPEAPVSVPAVAFIDARGGAHSLEEFRGRYVLLNLWATWCAPCLTELPALAALSHAMDKRRFVVVAVALPPGDIVNAQQFLAAHNASHLTAYFDSQTMFMRSFHAYGLPMTVLINPQGHEIGRAVGAASWDAPSSIRYLKQYTNEE